MKNYGNKLIEFTHGVIIAFMQQIIKKWLPVIVWMGLIFFLSHQPNLKSGLDTWIDLILRKIAHIVEYAILTWLLIRALRSDSQKISKRTLIIAAVIALIYAVSDEYHQSFILGREGAIRDVLVDAVGVIIMVIGYVRLGKEG